MQVVNNELCCDKKSLRRAFLISRFIFIFFFMCFALHFPYVSFKSQQKKTTLNNENEKKLREAENSSHKIIYFVIIQVM